MQQNGAFEVPALLAVPPAPDPEGPAPAVLLQIIVELLQINLDTQQNKAHLQHIRADLQHIRIEMLQISERRMPGAGVLQQLPLDLQHLGEDLQHKIRDLQQNVQWASRQILTAVHRSPAVMTIPRYSITQRGSPSTQWLRRRPAFHARA